MATEQHFCERHHGRPSSTVGGALGAGLESDEAVREAAYAARSGDAVTRRAPDPLP